MNAYGDPKLQQKLKNGFKAAGKKLDMGNLHPLQGRRRPGAGRGRRRRGQHVARQVRRHSYSARAGSTGYGSTRSPRAEGRHGDNPA